VITVYAHRKSSCGVPDEALDWCFQRRLCSSRVQYSKGVPITATRCMGRIINSLKYFFAADRFFPARRMSCWTG
jgi:hypothetical protein